MPEECLATTSLPWMAGREPSRDVAAVVVSRAKPWAEGKRSSLGEAPNRCSNFTIGPPKGIEVEIFCKKHRCSSSFLDYVNC